MKIRNGFVSNSSSSSFLVVKKNMWDNKVYLTQKEEKLLIDYGFKKVECYCADQVDCDLLHETKAIIVKERKREEKQFEKKYGKSLKKDDKERNCNYGYSVDCNQDDVILFLLKNNITFEASCHYGDYTVLYKKGEKNFLTLQNYGVQCRGIYSSKSYEEVLERVGFISEDRSVEKVNVKDWIKNRIDRDKEFEKEMAKGIIKRI